MKSSNDDNETDPETEKDVPCHRIRYLDAGVKGPNLAHRGSYVSNLSILTTEERERRTKILRNDLLLHEAAIKSDVDAARSILKEPVDVDSRNNYGRAPIHWAASRGNTDIMEMLINAKCDIEARDKYGMRPLLMAAWHGHKDAVQLLINSGACVNAVNKKKYSLLMCACRNNRLDVVEFLLDSLEGVDVDATDSEGQSALFHAAQAGHAPLVRRLVEAGASTDLRDKCSRTALHIACEHGHRAVVELFLTHEADLDARDEHGNTPLHTATQNQQTDIVHLLLENNTQPDPQNLKGLTPLHVACSCGSRGIINALLQHSSAVNKQCKDGNTPLHVATQANEIETVESLIEKGADLNCLNNRLQSAMHIGAELGYVEICRVLLTSGADIEQREQSGRTPLYIAARGSFTAIVDMIIKTARLDYPSVEEPNGEGGSIVNRKRWRFSTDEGNRCTETERIRAILWRLAYKHLAAGEWKRLAMHWAFTSDQIKAIEHQYTGPASYKEHGYRMLLIWCHGLSTDVNPLKELYESLCAIDKKSVADSLRKRMEKQSNEYNKRSFCHNCSIV